MKNLEEIKYGVTHAGRFHTDDVISSAFLLFFNKDVKILRIDEFSEDCEQKYGDDTFVFDIGLGNFDHHQENRKLNDQGIPYSAFGLIWEAYGRYYLKCNNFKNVEEGFNLFKERFVYKIDKGDNFGYNEVCFFPENDLIIRCNPLWYEECDGANTNERFFEAVKIGQCILDGWTRNIKKAVEDISLKF